MKNENDIIVDLTGETSSVVEDAVEIGSEEKVTGLKNSVMNADGTITVKLAAPVKFKAKNQSGQTVEKVFAHLNVKPFTGADIRALRPLTGDDYTLEMFARATGTESLMMKALYDRMSVFDITNISKAIEYFFENGPTTGR